MLDPKDSIIEMVAALVLALILSVWMVSQDGGTAVAAPSAITGEQQ